MYGNVPTIGQVPSGRCWLLQVDEEIKGIKKNSSTNSRYGTSKTKIHNVHFTVCRRHSNDEVARLDVPVQPSMLMQFPDPAKGREADFQRVGSRETRKISKIRVQIKNYIVKSLTNRSFGRVRLIRDKSVPNFCMIIARVPAISAHLYTLANPLSCPQVW